MLSHLFFDSADYPVNKRLDAVHDFLGRQFSIVPTTEEKDLLRIRIELWRLGTLGVMRTLASGARWYRTRFQDREVVYLRLSRQGKIMGTFADRPYHAQNGDVFLADSNYSLMTERHQSDQIVFAVPYSEVDYDPASDPHFLSFSRGTSEATFVARYANDLYESIPFLNNQEGVLSSQTIYGIVCGLLLPYRNTENEHKKNRNNKRLLIQSYIDSNLIGNNIDVDQMCRKFAVSRSTLFRLFGDVGGIQRYAQQRKLEHAYVELSRNDQSAGSVGRTARKYGFVDAAHFSKLFRAKFDVSPREIVGIGNQSLSQDIADAVEKRKRVTDFESFIP